MKETIVIDNFTGSLTRKINGEMNSGLAKFYSSWGYNPFNKPGNLTWNVAPVELETIDGLVLDGKVRLESGVQNLYFITNTGHFYKYSIAVGATDLHTFVTGTPTWNYGASLEFFNGKVWISNDKGLSTINFDGTGETQVGIWDATHFIQNTYHPLVPFQGKLYVGNTTDGTSTNIGEIDSTNLIINYNRISPAFPIDTFVRDMDITSDFSYLTISASAIPQENFTPGNDTGNAAAGDSGQFKWNGTDTGITAGISLPNFGITALNNFGQSEYSFMYDSIGAGLYDGGEKKVTLPNNKSPLPNATAATGNLITWMCPEVQQLFDPPSQTSLNSLYFYGRLDEESPVGFWRMFRQLSDLDNGSVNQVPFMAFFSNQYVIVESNGTLSQSLPFQLYSRQEFTTGSPTNQFWAFTFIGTVGETSDASIVEGIYETQTQLFEKKVSADSIRVYVESTVDGNAFQLDLIGMDGIPISGANFIYSFDPGTDITKVQGSLTRINFNPEMAPTYAIGVRVTNIGVTNMTFRKIEVDVTDEGK